MRKKVLILANDEFGLYNFRSNLIKEIINRGNEVYISTPIKELENKFIELGCKIVETIIERRSINPISDLKLLKFYNNIINDIKPDLIITYTIKPNIYGNMLARFKGIDSYANITGLGTAFNSKKILKTVSIILYKFALKRTKIVYFENVMNKNIFVVNNIVKEKNTVVLNGAGVDLDKFSYYSMPNNDKTIFLFMSRIMKEKGIDELLESVKRIKDEYKDKVVFNFLGSYEENYEKIIKEYVEMKLINYYGSVNNVQDYIKDCNAVILPSYHEGMSNTLLESAATGRILVTSNIHGCKEAVIDGETGYLAEVKNAQSLYEQLIKVIQLPYNEREKMSKRARKHMEEIFDKNKVVNETLKYINF